MSNTSERPKIEALFAWVSIDEEGRETLVSAGSSVEEVQVWREMGWGETETGSSLQLRKYTRGELLAREAAAAPLPYSQPPW
jgi:hypothetical protein